MDPVVIVVVWSGDIFMNTTVHYYYVHIAHMQHGSSIIFSEIEIHTVLLHGLSYNIYVQVIIHTCCKTRVFYCSTKCIMF